MNAGSVFITFEKRGMPAAISLAGWGCNAKSGRLEWGAILRVVFASCHGLAGILLFTSGSIGVATASLPGWRS
jgi:hypothetical protein